MRKICLAAATTYRRQVRSTTFWILTVGLPLLMVIAGSIPILTETRGSLPRIGYVDQTEELAMVASGLVGGDDLALARLFRAQTLLSGELVSARRFWSALTAG